jgi:hypothetical protein
MPAEVLENAGAFFDGLRRKHAFAFDLRLSNPRPHFHRVLPAASAYFSSDPALFAES